MECRYLEYRTRLIFSHYQTENASVLKRTVAAGRARLLCPLYTAQTLLLSFFEDSYVIRVFQDFFGGLPRFLCPLYTLHAFC